MLSFTLTLILTLIILYFTQKFIRAWTNYRRNYLSALHIPHYKQFIPHNSKLLRIFRRILPSYIADLDHEVWKKHPKMFADKKSPIICLIESTKVFVLVNDADLAREVLLKRAKEFPKPVEIYGLLKKFGENVVTTPDGPEWKRHRTLCAPAFSNENLKLFHQSTVEHTNELFSKWDRQFKRIEKIDYLDFDVLKDITYFTLGIISESGFGQKLDLFSDNTKNISINTKEVLPFQQAMQIICENLLWIVGLPKFIFTIFGFTQRVKTIKKGFTDFDYHLKNIIDTRRKELEQNIKKSDLLSLLMESKDSSSGETISLTNEEVYANSWIFLFAGHETTAHTIVWALILLALNPEKQEKFYNEVNKVLNNEKRAPKFEEVIHLNYSRCVFKETLRIFSQTPSIPKCCRKPTKLGDYIIPANAIISIAISALHKNPNYWSDPESFEPERFDEQVSSPINQYAFIPFSTGPRSCIGMSTAYIEGIVFLSMFVQNFKVSIIPGTDVNKLLEPVQVTTVTSQYPSNLRITRRI
eukprot:TRINITY_DN4583_c0_g1_i1.p1 TRINITY_DN4583_c0_g1~~TRINITY_DN4583_c0_g1_i1.p1  ORF type:complete len:527 (+),score=205.57 TRINITY_DN4583_c0_g1_i1:61-1641(+)